MLPQLKNTWTDLAIIHVRPRYLQSLGYIERTNGDLATKLGKWVENHQKGQSTDLPSVVYGMSTSLSSTTKATRYEIVFGQHTKSSFGVMNRSSGVMVSVLATSAVDRGFEYRSDQTKDYTIGICCFSAKHAALRRKSKDWSARNQDNMSECGDMSTRGLLFQ